MNDRPGSAGPDLSALRIDESARRGPTARRRAWGVVLALAGLAVIAGLVAGLRSRKVVVQVATARSAAAEGAGALLNASGYVTPRRRATVAAKITGRVAEIFADEGLQVQAGQVLATLDDAEARFRLTAAERQRDVAVASVTDLEVNLVNARRELQRAEELQRGGVESVQTLDLARTTVDSLVARLAVAREDVRAADAAVTVARQDLDNCTVRAPFAGVVVSKDAQRGEMVSPISAGGGFTRTGIATIVDMTSLEIEVDVNESYIAKVAPGQRVEAALDAYPDWKIPARVRTVIPTADRQKATVKVRIAFDALDPRILPDMGVKVAFLAEPQPGPGRAPAGVLIPRDAVRAAEGKPSVFVVREGRLERRAVSLGSARGDDVEIVSGAVEGDQVVVGGPPELREGARVEVKR